MFALPPAPEPLAVGSASASLTAPAEARPGSRILVEASGLRRGKYALTLTAPTAPDSDSFCRTTLATSGRGVTELSKRVTIPRRMTCFSGFPAERVGSIKVEPGKYTLQIGAPTSDNDASKVTTKRRRIKIT